MPLTPQVTAPVMALLFVLPATAAHAAADAPSERLETPPLRELEIVTGRFPSPVTSIANGFFSISNFNNTLQGLYYRHGLDRTLSVRVGFEAGEVEAINLTPPPDVDPQAGWSVPTKRLHLSFVTNGWIYGGAGLTYVAAIPGNFAYRFSDTLSPHAIAGLRFAWDPMTVGMEYRLGVAGPSALVVKGGFRF